MNRNIKLKNDTSTNSSLVLLSLGVSLSMCSNLNINSSMFKDLHVEASKNILNTPRYELLLDRFNEGDKYSFVDNKGMEEEDLILEEDIVYNINELL